AGLSAVISASVWPDPEDVKQGVVYGPQGFDYTGEFAGGGGPITRVMQGAEPETIIKTVIKTVYVDRPAASPTPGDGLVMIDGIQITPEAAVIVAARQATIETQDAAIASLRSENEALAALLMATMQ
uniref:hypothetical protein n=1 Tax=Accumulibacter sp. TaxID=2053492 RepID=UPI0028C4FA02